MLIELLSLRIPRHSIAPCFGIQHLPLIGLCWLLQQIIGYLLDTGVEGQILKIIKQEGFPPEMSVLDHTGLSTLRTGLDSGAIVGLSIRYDKLNPEEAGRIVQQEHDRRDRLLMNSEFGWGGDGYFSVPRAVLAMRRMGLKREEIERVTWENPKRFFGLQIE